MRTLELNYYKKVNINYVLLKLEVFADANLYFIIDALYY